MNTTKKFLFRYALVSVFFYFAIFHVVGLINEIIRRPALAIAFSFLVVYSCDFVITATFVFEIPLKYNLLKRFAIVTFCSLMIVVIVSKVLFIFVNHTSFVAILTSLCFAPLRFLIARNYVYQPLYSPGRAIRESIAEASRLISLIIGIFDKANRQSTPSSSEKVNYLKSLLGFGNVTLLSNLDLPWWPFSAAAYVQSKICNRKIDVFEWGSGSSTVWLSRRSNKVVSVEHDQVFAAVMKNELVTRGIENVSLILSPAQFCPFPSIPSGKSGFSNLDFFEYVKEISKFDSFDLIIIDGRARVECWTEACQHLNQGGLIIFDNYKRSRYKFSCDGFRVMSFSGLTPASVWPTHTLIAEKL